MESWSKISGFPNYQVSNHGRVLADDGSKKTQVKPYEKDNGYLNVDLYANGIRTGKRVHILVADAFVSGKKSGYTVDHIDRNRHNNSAKNLRWSTTSDQNKNRTSWAKAKEV